MDNFTILNFTNIDEEDFEGMYTGKAIIIRRGQTKAFPEKIAKHLADQLIYKILVRKGKDPYLDVERELLVKEMLGDESESTEKPIIPSDAESKAVPEEKEEEFPELKEKKKRGRSKK